MVDQGGNAPGGANAPANPYDPDMISRIIMLIYGVMDEGEPFWCYVAVKPSMYDGFKQAEAAGTLDLYKFEPFGEVVVSGKGKTPPQEVTLKVAEMYGTDASKFFQPLDPKQAIADKIAELKAGEQTS